MTKAKKKNVCFKTKTGNTPFAASKSKSYCDKKASTTKKAPSSAPKGPKKATRKAAKALPGTLTHHGKENRAPAYAGKTQTTKAMLARRRPVNDLRFPSARIDVNPDNLYSLNRPPRGDMRRRVNNKGVIQGSITVRPNRGAIQITTGGVKSRSSIGKFVAA